VASGAMATAIDFRALMREERARIRCAAAAESSDAPATAAPAEERRTPEKEPTQPRDELPACARPALLPVEWGVESVQHVAEWVSAEEEAQLIACIDGAPAAAWTALRGRRLQSLGGLPRPPPECMTREPLPLWVDSVCEQLVSCGVFPADARPNHVLLNEYQPGQGIDAHKDGPLYAPNVAILSLNSSATFQFVEDSVARAPLASLLLPRRGLLVFRGDAYERFLHTVPADESDDLTRAGLVRLDGAAPVGADGSSMAPRGRRLSLTVRHVLHSRTPEQQAEIKPSLAEPLPLWDKRQREARWRDG